MELREKWVQTGSDIHEFFEGLRALEAATTPVVVDTQEIDVAAVANERDAEDIAMTSYPSSKDGAGRKLTTAAVIKWAKDAINAYETRDQIPLYYGSMENRFIFRPIPKDTVTEKFGEDMVKEEIRESSKLMFGVHGQLYPVSPIAINTIMLRAGLGGDCMFMPGVGRAVEVARSFYSRKPSKVTLIIRKMENNAGAIYAAHSGKYAYLPQTIMVDMVNAIAEGIGNLKGEAWNITHDFSELWASFTEVAEDFKETYPALPEMVVPGLYICSSDTGNSSVIVRGFWTVAGHRVYGEELKRSHRGTPDLEELVKDTKQQIWGKYAVLPNRLLELLEYEAPDPMAMVKAVFKETGLNTVLGRKRKDEVLRVMETEFEPGAHYTAYDVAMMVAALPDRLGSLGRTLSWEISKLCSKAVFADALTPNPGEDDDEEEVTIKLA